MPKQPITNDQVLIRESILEPLKNADERFPDISSFFEFFVASQLAKDYDLDEEEILSGLLGSSGDGGCDAMYVFYNNRLIQTDAINDELFSRSGTIEVLIIQAKLERSFREDTIDKWKTVSRNLLTLSHDDKSYQERYSKQLLEQFGVFKELYRRAALYVSRLKFRFVYATIANEKDLHPNVVRQGDELSQVVKDVLPTAEISVEFLGARGLLQLFQKAEQTTFVFDVQCSTASRSGAFVALAKLEDYYSFISDEDHKLNNRLFESNVRDYQGSNAVNTSIGETLSNRGSEDFWWLNNGVTILAKKIIPLTATSFQLQEPKIVNGMQTSREIFNYFSRVGNASKKDDRMLLVRLIEPGVEESYDRIIFATNNQTAVSKSALRSTDPIHVKLELYFKPRGLYYDRRKNYYRNQGKKSESIVSVAFLGQCMTAIVLQKPNDARARPSTILKDESNYTKLYNDSVDLKTYFNAAKIGKEVYSVLWQYEHAERNEKTDVLFYVIYAVAVALSGKIEPTHADLSKIDCSNITESMVLTWIEFVLEEYRALGGNDKVAKGPELAKQIKMKLSEKLKQGQPEEIKPTCPDREQ